MRRLRIIQQNAARLPLLSELARRKNKQFFLFNRCQFHLYSPLVIVKHNPHGHTETMQAAVTPSPHEMLSDKSYSTVNDPIPFAEITDFSFFSSTNV